MRAGEDTSPLADGSSNDAIVGGSSDNGDNGDNASANALDEDEHMAGERERCVDLLQAYKDTRKKGDWEVCVQLMTTITVDMAPATVAQSLLDVGMLVPLNKK